MCWCAARTAASWWCWPDTPTGPGCRCWAVYRSAWSTPRSPLPPALAASPASTGWPPPCSTTAATRPSGWSRSTTSGGRSKTAYLELKSSILGGRVLRARTPDGLTQEVYALLVTYQILRIAITDATSTQPDVDPDRGSFTIALHAARDQLVKAAGVLAATVIDLVGAIGRRVLANLLPDRRLRVTPRIVKRAISQYNARGPNINRPSYKATLDIDTFTPPDPLTTSPGPYLPGIATSP